MEIAIPNFTYLIIANIIPQLNRKRKTIPVTGHVD
jgi:hypothetical protein